MVSKVGPNQRLIQQGTFLQVVPEDSLVLTEAWEDVPGQAIVHHTFDEAPSGRTTVTTRITTQCPKTARKMAEGSLFSTYSAVCERFDKVLAERDFDHDGETSQRRPAGGLGRLG